MLRTENTSCTLFKRSSAGFKKLFIYLGSVGSLLLLGLFSISHEQGLLSSCFLTEVASPVEEYKL